MSIKNNDSALLYDLFLGVNRRLLSITRRLAPPLTLSESHILGEIYQQKIVNSTTLIKNLHIEKTKVSRIVASFTEKKLITAQLSHADKRIRYFSITPEGRTLYLDDNEMRNQQVIEFLINLAPPEQRDLATFLQTMADAFGASSVNGLPGDPVCKVEIRRLTRAMGYLGDNLLGLGLPVDECQLMHLAMRENSSISLATLKELLPYEMTMISRLTSSLAERLLLKKQPLPFDKRHIQVVLTAQGIARSQRNLKQGGEVIMKSLTNIPSSSRKQLTTLLEKVLVGTPSITVEESRKISIDQITSEEMRQSARTFLLEALVSQKRVNEIRESVIHHESFCFQLTQLGKPCGVCEIGIKDNIASVIYFVVSPDLLITNYAQQLLATTAAYALKASQNQVVPFRNLEVLPSGMRDILGRNRSAVLSERTISLLRTTI